MEVTLKDILLEIKSLRQYTNEKFEQQNKEIDKKFEQQNKEINQRFEQQNKEIDKRFEQQNKEIDQRFDQQSKEIAEEIRNVVDFICKRQDKQTKDTKKEFRKELKSNKVDHDSYNAKMYKLELGQSNLEAKVYDLENN